MLGTTLYYATGYWIHAQLLWPFPCDPRPLDTPEMVSNLQFAIPFPVVIFLRLQSWHFGYSIPYPLFRYPLGTSWARGHMPQILQFTPFHWKALKCSPCSFNFWVCPLRIRDSECHKGPSYDQNHKKGFPKAILKPTKSWHDGFQGVSMPNPMAHRD